MDVNAFSNLNLTSLLEQGVLWQADACTEPSSPRIPNTPSIQKPVAPTPRPPDNREKASEPQSSPALDDSRWHHALIVVAGATAKVLFLVLPLHQLSSLAFAAAPNSLTYFAAWMGLFAFAMQMSIAASAIGDLYSLTISTPEQPPIHSNHFSSNLSDFWQRWQPGTQTGSLLALAPLLLFSGGLSSALFLFFALHVLLLKSGRLGVGKGFWGRLPFWMRSILILTLVLVSWILFRSVSLQHALSFCRSLFGHHDLTETALLTDARMMSDFHLLLFIFSTGVVLVLPPLRSLARPTYRWKMWLAAAVLLISIALHASSFVRGKAQGFLIQTLRQGSREVYVGREGWLFDARELNALTGTGPLRPEITAPGAPSSKAVDSIIRFAGQLKERGLPLLLIPLPLKASIYPEYITGTDPEFSEAPLYHPSQPELYDRLIKAGVDVQDVTNAMLQLKERKRQVFFKQDSHWTPDAMQELARAIAAHVRKKYPGVAAADPLIQDARAPDGLSDGDLANLLGQKGPQSIYAPERAVLLSFPNLRNEPSAPVALLGGSDIAIFDDPDLGFVPSTSQGQLLRSGFAQHLAVYLGLAIDTFVPDYQKSNTREATKSAASLECRHLLAQRLDDEVRAKKLVIWLIPARDLILPPTAGIDWSEVTFNQTRRPPDVILPTMR